jgi:predicted metal-binding membrane protein
MSSGTETEPELSSTALVTALTLGFLIMAGWAALIAALPPGLPTAGALWAAICSPVPQIANWAEGYAAALSVWLPMVPAMMLPSAIPMTLAFAARIERQGGAIKPILLISAYLGVWLAGASVFALIQTVGALALVRLNLPATALGILGGFAIGLAGLWQFAPLKLLSLAACRHDFGDMSEKPSLWQTIAIGAGQGIACMLCCWALMLAAAAAGAMNLVWMAILAAVMTAEKMIGPRATAPLGLVLIVLGTMIGLGAVGAGPLLAYWRS